MTEEEIESAKNNVIKTINILREEHQKHLAPYIKMLVDLENIRPRTYEIQISHSKTGVIVGEGL